MEETTCRRRPTCLDAAGASGAPRAEGAPPAGDRWHGSVGVAADPAGVSVAGRRHRVAEGRVWRQRGGVRHLRPQQLGARHPTGAQPRRGGEVQRAGWRRRRQVGRGRRRRRRGCRPAGVRRVGDVHVVAGEAVVGRAQARVGAERQGGVRVWVGQRRRLRHQALALHRRHRRAEGLVVGVAVRLLAQEEGEAVAVLDGAPRWTAVAGAQLRLQLLLLHLLQRVGQHARLVARLAQPVAAVGRRLPLHLGLEVGLLLLAGGAAAVLVRGFFYPLRNNDIKRY